MQIPLEEAILYHEFLRVPSRLSRLNSAQFRLEWGPPAPARNSTFPLPSVVLALQFHKHAPQYTHFSRSNAGMPFSPRAIACPEHISMQTFGWQSRHNSGRGKMTCF